MNVIGLEVFELFALEFAKNVESDFFFYTQASTNLDQ